MQRLKLSLSSIPSVCKSSPSHHIYGSAQVLRIFSAVRMMQPISKCSTSLLANLHQRVLTKIRFVQFRPIFHTVVRDTSGLFQTRLKWPRRQANTDLCNKQGLTRVYGCSHQQVLAHHVAGTPLSYLMAAKHMAVPLFSFVNSLASIGAPYGASVFTILAIEV